MASKSSLLNSFKGDRAFQVELEFGNVGFCGGRKTGVPGEKPSEQGPRPIFSVTLNNQETFIYGCKRSNSGSVLLTLTLLVHRNWFHSPLAADGQNGNGL